MKIVPGSNQKIKGYKIAVQTSEYAGIKQRWVVRESEIRKQAELKKIAKQVEKQLESAKAKLRKLSRQKFACIRPLAKVKNSPPSVPPC